MERTGQQAHKARLVHKVRREYRECLVLMEPRDRREIKAHRATLGHKVLRVFKEFRGHRDRRAYKGKQDRVGKRLLIWSASILWLETPPEQTTITFARGT